MWNDVIELGNLNESIVLGEVASIYVFHEVYANKKSVKQSEFYKASAAGLKPELVFEIQSFEFDNEEKVKFNGKVYEIIRVYDKGEITELVVSAMVL